MHSLHKNRKQRKLTTKTRLAKAFFCCPEGSEGSDANAPCTAADRSSAYVRCNLKKVKVEINGKSTQYVCTRCKKPQTKKTGNQNKAHESLFCCPEGRAVNINSFRRINLTVEIFVALWYNIKK